MRHGIGRYPDPEAFRLMTLTDIMRELDRSPARTRTVLHRFERYLLNNPRIRTTQRGDILYDAAQVEVIKAVLGLPHREIPDGEDWLTHYERGEHE